VVEDPNAPGIVGIAFDTFDNDENFAAGDPNGCGGGGPCADRLGNISSAHSNGAQVDVQFVPDDALDTPAVANDTISFVNGNWIHVDATITLADNGSGGLGGFLDMVLTDTVTGNTFQPFAGIALPFVPQDMRLAFGARTGGAFDEHAVDNVLLSYTPVPEPSTFVLFGLASAGLYMARRRKK